MSVVKSAASVFCLAAGLWSVVLTRAASPSNPWRLGLAESPEAAKVAQWVKQLPPVSPERNHFSVLDAVDMITLSTEARDYIKRNGPAAFYANPPLLRRTLLDLNSRMSSLLPALAWGGLLYLRTPQDMPWGMIEVRRGQFEFALSDFIVSQVDAQGLTYIGTVLPLADWDLAALPYWPPPGEQHKFGEDFYYLALGGKIGPVQDVSEFVAFLRRTVERYDGDRVGDGPPLRNGIKYWQLDNEPECSYPSPNDYVDLMRRSYQAIHAVCRDCRVLNGGAGLIDKTPPCGQFWNHFAASGGAASVDIIALHYNDGKEGASSISDFETRLTKLRLLLGPQKPVWVTEFGVAIDTGQGGSFTLMSEKEAGAWFVRFYTAGLANGVDRFFSDVGDFYQNGTILLPFHVNKLLEAKLGGFRTPEKLADGQYRFSGHDSPVYVLWNGMPAALEHGWVTVTDMYGHQQFVDADTLKPSEASPLIVERGMKFGE